MRFVAAGRLRSPSIEGARARDQGPQARGSVLWVVLRITVGGVTCGFGPLAAAQPDLEHLDATRSRPLFAPMRRPPVLALVPPAPPAVSAVLPQPPSLQLSGVVVGPNRTFAIVRRTADAKLVSLEIGRDIDGWSVEAIRPREVDLRRGTQTSTIRLPTR